MNEKHPAPWTVMFNRRCPEWHEQSSPWIADADGGIVATLPQFVGHPGSYDREAIDLAYRIVNAVNATEVLAASARTCPACRRIVTTFRRSGETVRRFTLHDNRVGTRCTESLEEVL